MVFNRLCDPESKLGILRWLETVTIPGVQTEKISHQQLLRSMDALIDQQQAVDTAMAGLLRPLIDQDLSIVFYDLTTIRAAGLSEEDGEVRQFGLSKEGVMNNHAAKSFCGSPAYLAPEMLKRSGHGKSVDWYLLGCLLYEMLVGIPPYYSNNK
jgi:serine/threonine protein kinase